jgi:hypothetical protein
LIINIEEELYNLSVTIAQFYGLSYDIENLSKKEQKRYVEKCSLLAELEEDFEISDFFIESCDMEPKNRLLFNDYYIGKELLKEINFAQVLQ